MGAGQHHHHLLQCHEQCHNLQLIFTHTSGMTGPCMGPAPRSKESSEWMQLKLHIFMRNQASHYNFLEIYSSTALCTVMQCFGQQWNKVNLRWVSNKWVREGAQIWRRPCTIWDQNWNLETTRVKLDQGRCSLPVLWFPKPHLIPMLWSVKLCTILWHRACTTFEK